ncbi:hypothetical protein GCM10023213_25120 [Prosthecobacter algae]|uniref:Uncharacterized protein n=1 Tax=Prosthecobacter algae TaxID=1144682 RepID=A0ABP9P5Q0_9BACT
MKSFLLFLLLCAFCQADDYKQFGRTDTFTLVTLPVDEQGVPDLEVLRVPLLAVWQPPQVVPLIKTPAPEVASNEVAEPKVVWFADRVERQWEVRLKTARELAADALAVGYTVQPEGFVLSLKDRDRSQFTQMLNLVREAQALGLITDATPQSIADASDQLHVVTTLRFRQIMVSYGLHYKALWDAAKGE